MRLPSRERLSFVFLVLIIGNEFSAAQLSSPIASDEQISVDDNKFLQRTAEHDATVGQEEEIRNICPQNVQLRWMSEVSSSIYATPLITDLYSDGRKDIIVPSFVHYLEVLEGADGAKAVGWPAFHKSTQHSSPLLYDIDVDGVRDILIATYDGEIQFCKDTGEMGEVLHIPRLRVKRSWYKDLVDGGIDHSHPDVGSDDEESSSLYNTFMQHNQDASKLDDSHASTRGPPSPGHVSPPAKAAPDDGGAQSVTASAPKLSTGQVPLQGAGQGADAATGQVSQGDVDAQVLEYVKNLEQLRTSSGEDGVKRMLEKLQEANPTFFKAVVNSARMVEDVKKWEAEKPPQAASGTTTTQTTATSPAATTLPAATTPPATPVDGTTTPTAVPTTTATTTTPPTPTASSRRRLMAVDEDTNSEELVAPGRQLKAARITSRGAAGGQAGSGVPGDAVVTADQAALDEQHEAGKADGADGAHVQVGAELDGQLTDEASESFHVFEGDYDFLHHGNFNLTDGADFNWTEHYQDQHYHDAYDPDQTDLDLIDKFQGNLTAYNEALRVHLNETLLQSPDGTGAGRVEHSSQFMNDYHFDPELHQHVNELNTDDLYDEFGEKIGQGAIEEEADHLGSPPLPPFVYQTSPGDSADGSDHDRYDHLFVDDYHDNHPWMYEKMKKQWQDENYHQGIHQQAQQDVYVDAHVLTTPAIGDIDGDGHEELVVAVSYYYDREYYDSAEHKDELQGADPSKYIAGGVVVYDLRTRLVKWSQHLDLSTETTTYKAYIYSAVTLVDLDGDGKMEIVLGTSIGFLYVLDHTGQPRAGWPIQMGEIQGQILVADLNSDGKLEIFAGDNRGSIALFDIDGKELWERHVKTLISQGATAGDVDGDGELEIVFGTNNGHVYVVRGSNGKDVPGFPFRTHGRIQSQVTITRLGNTKSQQLVVMSFDGFLYIIDGGSACADTVDIGESSYSMVLAEDIDGNGKLDLLVSTMNGNIYMFETYGDYHPLKTWPSQGANGQVARHDYFGVYAVKSSRQARDVMGDRLAVKFTIIDKRKIYLKDGTVVTGMGPYNVSVVLKGVGVIEMKAGAQPVIGVVDTLQHAGTYVMEVPCPRTRSTATIRIELTDGHRWQVSDEFSLSFHIHFYKLLKWLVALPLLAMAAVVMLLTKTRQEEAIALPS